MRKEQLEGGSGAGGGRAGAADLWLPSPDACKTQSPHCLLSACHQLFPGFSPGERLSLPVLSTSGHTIQARSETKEWLAIEKEPRMRSQTDLGVELASVLEPLRTSVSSSDACNCSLSLRGSS